MGVYLFVCIYMCIYVRMPANTISPFIATRKYVSWKLNNITLVFALKLCDK